MQRGFTLVELVVAVAVVAIVSVIAVPSMSTMLNNSRLTTQANELVSAIQLARSEAVRLNRVVEVCRSTNGSSCEPGAGDWGWWLVVAGNGDVIRAGKVRDPLKVTATGFPVAFLGNGVRKANAAAQISVCVASAGMAENRRSIELIGAGRISVSKANGAGVC